MLRPYGEVLDEMEHEAKYQPAVVRQQIVARIKRSSKYYGQTAPGEWFAVEVVGWDRAYPVRGNNNNYRTTDLAFGIRLDDGEIVQVSP